MGTVPLTAQLEQLRARLREDLCQGPPLEGLLKRAGKLVIEELLKGEVADVLGRENYERRAAGGQGYRNGTKRRRLRTPEGLLEIDLPQVRDVAGFASRIWPRIKGASPELRTLATEMYARGLSTRDIEATLQELQGPEEALVLSKSSVSVITEALWQEHQAFVARDLSGYDVVYLFADAVYESLQRQAGCRGAILVTWGITLEGARVLLHLSVGNKESAQSWTEHFRSLVQRGLKSPLTVTTDGAPGLMRAVAQMWPEAARLRCWFHKMKNVLDKVPQARQAEIKTLLSQVRDAPDHATGQARALALARQYQRQLPSAMACFLEDLEASLEHLKLPAVHRRSVRTTNVCERSFVEQRRRAKVLPRFRSEQECLKLVFATLIRVSARWQRIRFTDYERTALQQYIEDQRKAGRQMRSLLEAA